jgi:sarcosine oxidase subunit gamma
MAEARRSPLDGLLPCVTPDGAVLSGPLARQALRLRPPYRLSAACHCLQPNRVAVMRGVRTLWLGPDEWLITAADGAAPDLLSWIRRAAADRRGEVTDLSASRIVIEIAGREARTLLEKGCGLDLHPRAFTAGCCAQTLFAKLPVIIDQINAAPSYRLFVRRSAARWLCDWLIDAAEEFRFTG